MENKSKQNHTTQRHVTDYERSKILRGQENQERLRELGIKNIAKSLTSLVESRKTKKKKVKSVDTTERDVDLGDNSEGEYQEVSARGQVSKKQHRAQYIAPMSMTKYANMAKQRRVIAPNVSHMFPFDTNITTNKRLPQQEEDCGQNESYIDTNVAKQNQSRATTTLGELILNKKGSKKGVLEQNIAKHNSITSGARRKLVLVDNDDDGDDDDISQDMEQLGFRDEENELDNVRSQELVNQGDENEGIDKMIFESIHNGIEEDNSEDDLEHEDNELVQEQSDCNQSEKETGGFLQPYHRKEYTSR